MKLFLSVHGFIWIKKPLDFDAKKKKTSLFWQSDKSPHVIP